MPLSSALEAFCVKIIQLLDSENFLHGAFEIIFKPHEMHLVFFDEHIAGPVILIPGLSDGTDIDDGLLVIDDRIDIAQFVRQVEIGLVEEHTRHVGMPHKANVLDAFEKQPDFKWIRVDVVREDVFINWTSR